MGGEPEPEPVPTTPPSGTDVDASAPATKTPLELNVVFVHGVGSPEGYLRSDLDLVDVEAAVLAGIGERRAAYEAGSGRTLAVTSTRLNLYTDLAGNLPTPGTDEGSGQDVAAHWRGRLAEKLAHRFPNGEKNIVLVGHSTGARAAMEVAADVGGADNVLGAGKWGFSQRIAGVVSAHGMIDAVGGYRPLGEITPIGPACKVVKPSGWCDYARNVSAVPAADWVATHLRSLVLTSAPSDGRCGISLWSEPSDQLLPLRAQGNPAAVGIGVSADGNGVFRPAHGIQYGEYCHSDITNKGSPRHFEAVEALASRVTTWLFDDAPRVVNVSSESQTYDTPVLQGLTSSSPFAFSFSCPAGSPSPGTLDVVGNCHHPGFRDGDDHAMGVDQLVSVGDDHCGGTVAWKNVHDHPHSGTVWFKSYAGGAGGVLATLP